jgi:methylated-DNA-[protein]-cysteine S-methyltransferase
VHSNEIEMFYKEIESPVGQLLLLASENKLLEIRFNSSIENDEFADDVEEKCDLPIFHDTEVQLDEYFRGKRDSFSIPMILDGTEFQQKVWKQLQSIPFGETISYQELAERVGDKKKARAVGNANGKNPIPIIIPCHRVIAKDGSLGGFGGGLPIKRHLLELEGIVLNS